MDDDNSPITITVDGAEYTTCDPMTPTFSVDVNNTFSVDTNIDTIADTITFDYNYNSTWPSEYKINQMIQHYPALKIQYEKFLEVYNLVKDDYKDDDDLPF